MKLQMEELKAGQAMTAAEDRERRRTEIQAELASTLDQVCQVPRVCMMTRADLWTNRAEHMCIPEPKL